MRRSTERILTTHVGSLARPADLLDMMRAKEHEQPYDAAAYDSRLRESVADVVRRQVENGVDVVSNGEQSKSGFAAYIGERLAGFEPRESLPGAGPWGGTREALAFPEFYERPSGGRPASIGRRSTMVCTGPVSYRGQQQLRRDIENLEAAVKGLDAQEAFVPSISCSDVEGPRRNEYYASDEEYLFAIADAMREEYNAIVDAGFLLQIDDPRLVTYYLANPSATLEVCRRWAEVRVEAINHSLRDIPQERVRFHTCYGINMGPRVHDMELKDIVDIMVKINAGAYSFEAANPRHDHEWQVWENVDLPEGKTLIPGVISNSTVLVEHPDLVAQRLARYASVVGKENVIAGSDCGFSSQATLEPEIHPTVVWAKFEAMAEGARRATEQLW